MLQRTPYVLSAFLGVIAAAMLWPAASQAALPDEVLRARPVLSHDGVAPGGEVRLAVVCELAPDWHVNSHTPSQKYLIPTELVLEDADGLNFSEVSYPPGHEVRLGFSEQPLSVYDGRFLLGVVVRAAGDAPPGPRIVKGRVEYQACDDTQCLRPAEVLFEITLPIVAAGSPVAQSDDPVFSQIAFPAAFAAPTARTLEEVPASPTAENAEQAQLSRLLNEWGLLVGFIFIFLGGLALNLTPCVYPLIPITIGFFISQAKAQSESESQSGNRRLLKSFSLALVYVLGMSVTYSALGVAAASSGGLFGAALQSPWVLGSVSLVLVALALSSFGLFTIQLPAVITNRMGGGGRKGYVGAALMGLTVGFVAAPCIGPFVLGLLLYVGKIGNPVLGFWMFFVLAMGLGLPYLILGTFSGDLNRLPRSGAWMVWVKKVFGVVLLGMAIYFLEPVLPKVVFTGLLVICLAAGGIYLGFIERTSAATWRFAVLKRGVGLVSLAAGVFFLVPSKAAASPAWAAYNEAALEQAQQDGKLVLIDFSAKWCIPCKELDAITFADPEVIQATKGMVTLKADLTQDETPEVEALRKRYKIRGLPWIVFLDATGRERTDLRVTEFVPPAKLLERIHRLRETADGIGRAAR